MKQKLLLALLALFTLGGSNLFAQTDAEYAAANAEIQANGVYKIYTLSNGTSSGETKYYLKTDGYLTDDASAAGEFTFDLQRIFGGFKMAGYRINQFTNGGASDNTFSGDALKKIITSGQNRVDWEAQVFFKGESGYAVRSTNANSSNWGASAFWNVVADNDEDGLPNATYIVDAVPYVWQLEKVTDGDFSDVTAKYITNYNPVANANGWVATNGNRLNQWASNPINFDEGKNLAEMWNNQGASLKQTLNDLPAGYYNLIAIACSRQGQTSTLSAGTYSTPVEETDGSFSSTTGCQAWFNNGHGVNNLSFAVDATSNVEIGLTTGTSGDAWTLWRVFYLTYNKEPIALRKALAAAKKAANTALDNDSYTTVTGYERTQLTSSLEKTIDETGKTPSALTAEYNALIEEININLNTFTSAPQYYTQLAAANSKAAEFDIEAQSTDNQSAQRALDVQSKAIYNKVVTDYNTIIELGEWQTEGDVGTMTSQHWDGTSTSSYNEQSTAAYQSSSWTLKYYQTITLPSGDYVFKVAGRHSANSSLELNVKKGETNLGSVNDFPVGDKGTGINKEGTPSFFEDDAVGFANGNGRGWQWRYVPFTITEESAEITISIDGSAEQQSQWLSFCNYTVQSAPSVAASEIAYQQAKEAAEAALANETYNNVQGTDRSGLEAAIAADKGTTAESIDAATAAIQTATATFTAAKASWDNLANARTSASDELPYANAAKKTTLDAAVAAEVTGAAADAAAQVAVIEQANRQYVESNGLAEGVNGAVNKTNLITNPDADENADGWTGEFARLTSEQYTQGDGTLGGGYFDKNGSSSYTAEQTIENLAPGKYLVTVTARAQSGVTNYKVKAVNSRNKEFTATIPVVGNQGGVFGRGFNDAFVVFDQNFTGDATIGITASHSSNFWLSFDRFRLVRIADSDVTLATAEDYTALTNAINSVKDNILGFEKDEYAPYNNIEAAAMLKAAQEIDQTVENTQEAVQAATTNLTNATWNKNTEEVNAVYDGTFAKAEHNGAPSGWRSTHNEGLGGATHPRAFVGEDRIEEFNDTKSGFFIRFDGYCSDRGTMYYYGDSDGYRMPLKANTKYYVKADVAGWGSTGKPQRLNIDGPNGFSQVNQTLTLKSNADTSNDTPQQFLIIFTTKEAGNYTISFQTPGDDSNKHNAIVSNIELKKATVLEDNATDLPQAKNNAVVAYTRTLTAGFNSLVLPFDVTKEELGGEKVEEIYSYKGCTVTGEGEDIVYHLDFQKGAETLIANTPYLVKMTEAVNLTSFNSKEIKPDTEPKVEKDYFSFVGSYVALEKGNDVVKAGDYGCTTSGLKKAKNGIAMKAFRAYMKNTTGNTEAKVNIMIDGQDTDAITAVEIFETTTEGIYNLQGQKVNHTQKGVFIVNGKKVVVK